ncbi:putative vomeronasal receptor-like protein 4 [Ornithorhynchus anatinus]|uniref:putative vomeronasal receptor-like protein 4 n=1 Tax=Ornithorhynchus anatinus TaxID=9258 RepID=UPI0010A7F049|nr:putative vomeronasal receptor-like protein 4 [Ornithorhynchus anatinus]
MSVELQKFASGSVDVALGVSFLSKTGVGILGNSLLITYYLTSFLLGSKLMPTDLTIVHLATVHTVMLLTRWIVMASGMLGLHLVQNDAECKLFTYVYRITRALSICTTALLSVVQAITISPSNSYLFQLKVQIPNDILPVLAILWIPNSLISTNLLFQMFASSNTTNMDANCYLVPINTLLQGLILTFMALRDILSLGLMSCCSGYMVLLLHRHGQQVQHLHSPSQVPKTLPEKRATQTIVLLVSCFVVFYCGDLVLSLFLGSSMKNNAALLNAAMFVPSGYATISPFVLLTCDRRVIKFLTNFLGNRIIKSPQKTMLSARPL